MSTNLTLPPQKRMQFALEANVIGVQIILSPGFTPSAIAAMCSAAVALHTATLYGALTYFAKALSNSGIAGPQVR